MLSMRLMRFGAAKKPFYRIVVMESRRSSQSRAKDFIGNYNPLSDPVEFQIDLEKAKSWLAKGKSVGICGQGPSDHVDFAQWLVAQGIESISLNPDTVVETWKRLAQGS